MTEPDDHPLFDDSVEKAISEYFLMERGEPGASSSNFGPGTETTATAVEARQELALPKKIGRYPINGILGRGGLGIILRGEDPELGRDIAVKILRRRYRHEPEIVKQFLAEAQVTSRLQHPGVVPIHEVGHTEEGSPYFTMKIIEGDTLARLLGAREANRRERRRFLVIFENVCETIAFAHARGVVHRDLKPRNVMVGAFGEVQILDWGFATASSDATAEPDPDGKDGSDSLRIVGTPAYMAPEQARGQLDQIDPRTDVFALGAILTEILTGAPPYLAETRQEVYLKATKAWLEDAHSRLEVAGERDPELVRLARRCLSPDRQERPAHAGEVAAEVDAYLSAQDQRAHDMELQATAANARAQEERRARRLTLALSVAVGVAVLAVFGWLWVRAEAEQSVLVAVERASLLTERARAGDPTDTDRWDEVVTAAEQAAAFARGHNISADLQARVDTLLAEVRAAQAGAERDRRFLDWLDGPRLRQALDVGQKGLAPHALEAFRAWGIDLVKLTPTEAATAIRNSPIAIHGIRALDDLARYLRQAEVADPPWRRLVEIASAADGNRWRNEVREAFSGDDLKRLRALAQAPEVQGAPPDTLTLLASWLTHLGDPEEALRVWRQALHRYPGDYQVVHDLAWLLTVRDHLRNRREVLGLARVGVALRPRSVHAWWHLGQALADVRYYQQAQAAFRRGIQLDPEHKDISSRLAFTRALQLRDQGFQVEAVAQFLQVLAAKPDHRQARFQLGLTFRVLGDADAMVRCYQEFLDRDKESAEAWCNMAYGEIQQGRFDDALTHLKRGDELGRRRKGNWSYPSHKWIEQAREFVRLGEVLANLGDGSGPEDAKERARLAGVAFLKDRPLTALRLFESAFPEDADLLRTTNNLPTTTHSFRLLAAASAVAVATSVSGEAQDLDSEVRARWRRQALAWLRDELREIVGLAARSGPRVLRMEMGKWRHAAFLAAVRPGEGLEQHVPNAERQDWEAFWSEVEGHYGRPEGGGTDGVGNKSRQKR